MTSLRPDGATFPPSGHFCDMANYVLGPGAARRLREMMRGRMASGRIEGDAAHVVDEGGFEHPYKLTYAASAGAVDGETGEADGAWIIWLPDGCLVIDGEVVDLTANLTAANNYPSGWYDITDVFDGTDPDEFDLYLDASKEDPKFVIDPSDAENPVLIAKVNGKAVKGVVESALVFSKGGNKKPFDIVTEVSGDVSVRKLVRCSFWIMGSYVTLPDYTLPEMVEDDGGDNPDVRVVVIFNAPANQDIDTSNPGQYCTIGTEDDVPSGDDAADRVISTFRIYDFSANGAVKVDWRDVPIRWQFWYVDDNTVCVDENTAKSGQFHLKQFYGTERNLTAVAQTGATCHILVRYQVAASDHHPKLYYLTPEGLKNLLGIHGGGGGGGGGGDDEGGEDDPSGGVKKLNGLEGEVEIRGKNGVAVSVEEESKTINISIAEAGEGGQDNCNGWSDEAEDDEASENGWSDVGREDSDGGGFGGGGDAVGGNGWSGDNCEELNGWT